MADKRINDLIALSAAEVASKDDVYFGCDRIDVVPDVSRKVSLSELQAMTDITPEWTTVVVGDPTIDAQVISAIRGSVTAGRVKAKHVGAGSATDPEYAWELSATDALTRLKEPVTVDTDTNITTGTLAAATGARSVDLGGNSLTFTNASSISVEDATVFDAAVTAPSVVLPNGAFTATLTTPTLVETYSVELWPQLPTAGQVSSGSNFVRLDENGSLSFSAVSGTSANLSLGTVTGTTLDVDIDTGTSVTLPIATATDAGLLSAADKVIVDTVSSLPTADTNITTGTVSAATGARSIDLGSNTLDFVNVTTASIDAVLTLDGLTLAANGQTIPITAPPGLAASYNLELMDDLPTLTEVSNDEHFLKLDSTGKVSFGLPPGGGGGTTTNLTIGNVLAETLDVQSSSGTDATVPAATTLKAGLLTAADKVLVDTISSRLTAANLSIASQGASTLDVACDGGTDATIPAATGSLAGLMTATDKTLLDSLPTATNLTVGSLGASTLDVVSSSGTDATIPAATQSTAGLLTAADKTLLDGLPTADSNITTGTIAAATASRAIDFASYDLTFNNIGTYSVTASSQITVSSPRISAQSTQIDVASMRLWSGTNWVTVDSTGATETYALTLWATLPTPTDVANGANVVALGDDGQLSFGPVPTSVTDLGIGPRDGTTLDITSSTGSDTTVPAATAAMAGLMTAADKAVLDGLPIKDFSESVATKANRTASPATVGYRSFVESNQVEYEWDGAAYQIYKAESTGTSTERNGRTEMELGQVWNDLTLGKSLIYRTASPAGWYEQGVS